MKLYREVKGEEDHKHILFENGKGYVCDLEPIEITEEEIGQVAHNRATHKENIGDGEVDVTDIRVKIGFADGVKWILSNLKGE